eukprot:TRINITY_DN7165_c0_g1_i3.p1 TRINITY_DN7165_c0_g1~~TRINITY_DN7165_c0_g1_i3.p1  ORF type:complete len:509 (-),score=60.22 TRINITY_DN7165_c0_g1_i3:75-1601(-)
METPLHWAARKESTHLVVEKLLLAGSQVNAIDNLGRTPLHLACDREIFTPQTIKTLVRFGADLHIRDSNNKKPFSTLSPPVVESLHLDIDPNEVISHDHVLSLREMITDYQVIFPEKEVSIEEEKDKLLALVTDERDPTDLFELVELLGHGAFGRVWRAIYKDGQEYAIKICQREESRLEDEFLPLCLIASDNSDVADKTTEFFSRFFHNDDVWVVMELCLLGSITDIMVITDEFLTERDIAAVAEACLLVLADLHSTGIIHRDIKARNIMVDETGEIKLGDFGGVAYIENPRKKLFHRVGTQLWMSPEMISGEGYTSKTDIWSLGITIIEMAEGYVPHWDSFTPEKEIVQCESPCFSEPSKWSELLSQFLALCLRKDPRVRPSAKALLRHPFLANKKKHSLPIGNKAVKIIKKAGSKEAAMGKKEEDKKGSAREIARSSKKASWSQSVYRESGSMVGKGEGASSRPAWDDSFRTSLFGSQRERNAEKDEEEEDLSDDYYYQENQLDV